MRSPVKFTERTAFSMEAGSGQWDGKWVIRKSNTDRIHLILDTELEADEAMDELLRNAEIEAGFRSHG